MTFKYPAIHFQMFNKEFQMMYTIPFVIHVDFFIFHIFFYLIQNSFSDTKICSNVDLDF